MTNSFIYDDDHGQRNTVSYSDSSDSISVKSIGGQPRPKSAFTQLEWEGMQEIASIHKASK